MLPEQNGLLASLFTKFRRADRGRKKAAALCGTMPFARQVSLEQLEDRPVAGDARVSRLRRLYGHRSAGDAFLSPVTPAMAAATVGTGMPANFAGTHAFESFGLMGASGYTMIAFSNVLNDFIYCC